jgi:hypothetical protein
MHSRVRDLSGKRFGKLKVIKFAYSKKLYDKGSQRRAFFHCKCDCGGKKIVPGIFLHNKNTQSCGCIIPPKYKIDETYFEKINREDKAYFFGLLITDGTVSSNDSKFDNKRIILELDKNDKHILDTFRKYLKTKKHLGHSVRKARRYKKYKIGASDTYILNISNVKMREDAIKLGLRPAKTKNLSMPTNKIIPHKLMNHFIRGVFDGDGTVGKYGNSRICAIDSGSILFLKQLKKYLNKLNIKNTDILVVERPSPSLGTPTKNWRLAIHPSMKKGSRANKITAENLKNFYKLLYKDCSKNLFFIRKKKKFIKILK